MEESNENKVKIVKTYHENGQVKQEIEVVNNKRHGLYKSYHDNGQLHVAVRFQNGHQEDEIVDSFDENGMLIRTVEIINGLRNGSFKDFYSSGLLKKEGEYKDDEIIGIPLEYFEDGSIMEDSEDKNIEGIEDGNKSIKTFLNKSDFINQLKCLDEDDIIRISFGSKKWSINEKSIVTGEWNEKEYTLYADVWQKRADLIWQKSPSELIDLLAINELVELNSFNCNSLFIDSSDGSDINITKIEWESSLTDEEEEQFIEEYGDDGSQLYYEGDLEVDLFFETGAITSINVNTDNQEFCLKIQEDEDGNFASIARAMVLLDDEDKKNIENKNPASRDFFLHCLAFGYFLTDDFLTAIDTINKVIELNINEDYQNPKHYITRARINLKLNNKEKAIEDLKKALELDLDNEEAIKILDILI